MINFYILTLFPDFFQAFKNFSIIKKGMEKKLFSINIKNIRDHAVNDYGQVDDIPYGGGHGMLMRPEPVIEAFDSLKLKNKKNKVIYFSPKGRILDNNYINNLTKFKNIVLICGHYEGIDQRIIDTIVDDEISVGDFVLTGGEIPAMMTIDAAIRCIDGVIKKESFLEESFFNNLLEHRQYTRPAVFRDLKVPEVLISGHHKRIEEFKLRDSIKETLLKRPDLIDKNKFNKKIEKIINELREEIKNECN